MKKKVFLGLVLLVVVGASAVFAQSINGLWRSAAGNVFSIYDGKAVYTETNSSPVKEAERRGLLGIGSSGYRNIRSTGNLTWTATALLITERTYTVSWEREGGTTFTMSPDGRTMHMGDTFATNNSAGTGTWTRISNNEIDGLWRSAQGNVFSIYDGKAVYTETNSVPVKEAEKRGYVGIGSTGYRNIRSTGNLTWTATALLINSSYTVSWEREGGTTFTMSPDGRTMHMGDTFATNNSAGTGTWTRIE
jgi:hypothetical protein